MRRLERTIAAMVAGLLALPALAQTTVLSAARIHTMDTARPLAQAMAYDASGKILAVGDTGDLLARYPQASRLDLGKATVVPGLIDAHAHVSGLGFAMMDADLVDTRDKAEILERLRAKAAALKPGEWLIGRGWDQNDWPGKQFPTAADLDEAFPDRPRHPVAAGHPPRPDRRGRADLPRRTAPPVRG